MKLSIVIPCYNEKGTIRALVEAVRRAWRLHYEHATHSLVNGFYQGWDLHPAQIPARLAAVYMFFREEMAQQSERLKNFVAAAAQAMRRILVDSARRKSSLRQGGGVERVHFDSLDLAAGMDDEQLLALNDALDHLEEHDHAKAQVVKLRFFAGLTNEQAAQALGVSEPTVKRHWAYARAWLFRQMTT